MGHDWVTWTARCSVRSYQRQGRRGLSVCRPSLAKGDGRRYAFIVSLTLRCLAFQPPSPFVTPVIGSGQRYLCIVTSLLVIAMPGIREGDTITGSLTMTRVG